MQKLHTALNGKPLGDESESESESESETEQMAESEVNSGSDDSLCARTLETVQKST